MYSFHSSTYYSNSAIGRLGISLGVTALSLGFERPVSVFDSLVLVRYSFSSFSVAPVLDLSYPATGLGTVAQFSVVWVGF